MIIPCQRVVNTLRRCDRGMASPPVDAVHARDEGMNQDTAFADVGPVLSGILRACHQRGLALVPIAIRNCRPRGGPSCIARTRCTWPRSEMPFTSRVRACSASSRNSRSRSNPAGARKKLAHRLRGHCATAASSEATSSPRWQRLFDTESSPAAAASRGRNPVRRNRAALLHQHKVPSLRVFCLHEVCVSLRRTARLTSPVEPEILAFQGWVPPAAGSRDAAWTPRLA